MADRNLKSITFPGLPNRYVIPDGAEVDSSLTQQGKAADAKAVGDALKAGIAPAYSASSTYAVGEYVLHNNTLYRCTTAITTAEEWTAAHWTAAKLAEDLTDCSRQLSDVTQTTENIFKLKDVSGETAYLTYTINDNWVVINGESGESNHDIKAYAENPVTLSAGAYTGSFQGTWRTLPTIIPHFSDGSYGSAYRHANGIYPITFDSDKTIDFLLFRFSAANIGINAGFQLQVGQSVTDFMPPVTANDAVVEKFAKKYDDTLSYYYLHLDPIFSNGSISAGLPSLTNNSSCISWLVTLDSYKVKAGSVITYTGRTRNAMYFILDSLDENGIFVSDLVKENISSGWKYTFAEDCTVRMAMRTPSYDNLIPQDAYDNFTFILLCDEPQDLKSSCHFLGLGTGNSLSGQSQVVKLPRGDTLILDSHLLTYYTAWHDYLRNNGIRRIDYYVQSHYHGDHMGLLNVLKNNPDWVDITNATFFLPQEITASSLSGISEDAQTLIDRQNEFIALLEQNNCTIIRPTEGQVFDLGDGFSLMFYNTDHTVYEVGGSYQSANYNDWSLCCYLIYGQNAINFAADLGPIGQRKNAGTLPKATILTAPHHGWDNGPNNLIPAYINNVNPDVVISVNGWEHNPDNADSLANIMLATSPMQSFCEANGVSNYPTFLNGPTVISLKEYGWKFDGHYSRYIRNGKNWKYNDNTDKQE